MLVNLSIRNIVLIEQLDLALEQGLCVLTGETGAGKSILLDALGFALGERGNVRLLRHGAKQGVVSAEFDIQGNDAVANLLEEQGIEHESTLILRRIIMEDGKSKAFLNDMPVSVNLLKQVGEQLVEIHGQHDQRGLMESATHRSIIDAYGQLDGQVVHVENLFHSYKNAQQELEALHALRDRALQEEDYLRHISRELDELAPEEGEEAALTEKRSALMNKEKLLDSLNSAMQELQGAQPVEAALRSAQRILTRNPHLTADNAVEALERAADEVSQVVDILERLHHTIGGEGESLEVVEERLFALRDAARKHRVTVEELPGFYEQVKQKLALLGEQEFRMGSLEKMVAETKSAYFKEAQTLSTSRREVAARLEKTVVAELAPLKMENTRFTVSIEPLADSEWSAQGIDKVRFLASTNPGAPLDALTKIASGGELSRFMLAMKVVLAQVKTVPTMIFDEIDTGIGGAVAAAVGRRLEMLGKHVQVLVVTHQPQVAARGSQHLHIKKFQEQDHTVTRVTVLAAQERHEELARMLAGETITDEARAAAVRLLTPVE